ncbi:MAG: hypothetical protein H7296_04840 [Bacteroidia bacterium]|nr:hypothetical protein [Bacteroidia bacterium]
MKKHLLLFILAGLITSAMYGQDLKYKEGDTAYYLIVKNTPEKTDFINLALYPLVFNGLARNPFTLAVGGKLSVFYKKFFLAGGANYTVLDNALADRKIDRSTSYSFYSASDKKNSYSYEIEGTYYFLDKIRDSYFRVHSDNKPKGATSDYKFKIPARERDLYGLRFGVNIQSQNIITELPFLYLYGYNKKDPDKVTDHKSLYDFDRANYTANVLHIGLETMRVTDIEYYLDKTTQVQVSRIYKRIYADFLISNNITYTDAKRNFFNNSKLDSSATYILDRDSPKLKYGFRLGYEIIGQMSRHTWNASAEVGSYPGPGRNFTDGLGLRIKLGIGISKRQKSI